MKEFIKEFLLPFTIGLALFGAFSFVMWAIVMIGLFPLLFGAVAFLAIVFTLWLVGLIFLCIWRENK